MIFVLIGVLPPMGFLFELESYLQWDFLSSVLPLWMGGRGSMPAGDADDQGSSLARHARARHQTPNPEGRRSKAVLSSIPAPPPEEARGGSAAVGGMGRLHHFIPPAASTPASIQGIFKIF